MQTAEWMARKKEGAKVVIIVSKHKTGDREPASLVFSENEEDQMQR